MERNNSGILVTPLTASGAHVIFFFIPVRLSGIKRNSLVSRRIVLSEVPKF